MDIRKPPVFLFCLGCFGFGVTFLGGGPRRAPSARASSCEALANQERTAPKKITFENTSMGELEDEDGVHLGFTNFTASDGTTLRVLYENFGSPAKAQDYLERQVSRAVKVIERKKKLSSAGTVVSERAEILLRLSPQRIIPAVLWTDGVKFHEIYSASRDSILELEKVYRY